MSAFSPPIINLASYDVDGILRTGNIKMPLTTNYQYLLGSRNLPTASPFVARSYYPDISSDGFVQNFNNAYPGLEWLQPVWGYGFNGPCIYELIDPPAGMTIGSTMVRDNSTGYWSIPENYGVLMWPNPVIGRYRFGVRCTGQDGATSTWIFDLRVNTNNHFFMAPEATGDGTGSSPSNCAAYASTILGSSTVSPSRNKVLHIKGGNYPATAGITINAAFTAVSWVAMPGETPIFNQKVNIISNNVSLYGIKFLAVGTSDFGVVASYQSINNFAAWRCEFDECFKIGTGSNNNSCIGLARAGTGYGRRTIFISECIFRNSPTVAGYDFYTVNDHVFVRNKLILSNGTTAMPQAWIFPKLQANGGEIMYNFADVPNLTTTNDAVMLIHNSWEPSYPISYDINQRCEYNFIRTGGANIVRSNGDNDSVSASLNPNTLSNYFKRNTFIGGGVVGVFYNAQTARTRRHTHFESNIVINSTSGYTPAANADDWCFISGTNILGNSINGLVDENGRVIDSTMRGLTGAEIWS